MHFKTMMRNVTLLNALLIIVLSLFSAYQLSPMIAMKIKYTLPPAKKIAGEGEENTSQPGIPSIAEYTVISEENLFHPERRIPPEKKDEQQLPKPEFVLFGTLITDDVKLAYLEDLKAPRSTAGRGKRHTALKKGDAMSGFTLKEIETDKIVMVRGEEKMEISINDPAHPKDRKEAAVTTAAAAPSGKPQAAPQRRGQAAAPASAAQSRPARQARQAPPSQVEIAEQAQQQQQPSRATGPLPAITGSDIKTAPLPPPVAPSSGGGGGFLGISR